MNRKADETNTGGAEKTSMDGFSPASASDRQVGGISRRTTWSRILTGVVLVVYGLYHVAAQYYSDLDPRLLAPSGNGLAALAFYETGEYESASRYWRRHYRLTYDPASIEELRKVLEERIRQAPERMGSYYLLADLHFSREEHAESEAICRAALGRQEGDYDALLGLAISLAMQGEYREANALFARLFRQNSRGRNFAGVLQVLVLLDRLEGAGSNENADRYLTLANVNRYLRILDARRAKAVLLYADKALALDANLDDAHFCKALVFMKREEYDRALVEFARVVEINPGNADAYNRIGFIYGRTGNLEKELASYRKAVELESQNPLFAYQLGQILWNKYGDFRQAAFYFKRAFDLDPDGYDSLYWYGSSLKTLGEYEQALEVAGRIIERNPADPDGYRLKGNCLMEMERYVEAVEWYTRSWEVAEAQGRSPGLDFQAFFDLGRAYEKLKRPADAIAAYRQALKLKPHDVNTLFTLQYLCRIQQRYEEAYAAVKEILRIQPNHVGARSLLPYLRRNVAGGSGG